jgi:hypothetical protein
LSSGSLSLGDLGLPPKSAATSNKVKSSSGSSGSRPETIKTASPGGGRIYEEEKKETSQGSNQQGAGVRNRGASYDKVPALETDSEQSTNDGTEVLTEREGIGRKQLPRRNANGRRSRSPKQQQELRNRNVAPPSPGIGEEHEEFTYEYVEDDPNFLMSSEMEEEIVEEDKMVEEEVEAVEDEEYVEEEIRSDDDIFASEEDEDDFVEYEEEESSYE